MTDDSAEILFQSFFSAGGHFEQLWHGHKCPRFDVLHPAFALPTKAWPTVQGALKESFGEAVLAHDVPEVCEFPSLDSFDQSCGNCTKAAVHCRSSRSQRSFLSRPRSFHWPELTPEFVRRAGRQQMFSCHAAGLTRLETKLQEIF